MNINATAPSLTGVRAGDRIYLRTHGDHDIGDIVIFMRSNTDQLTFSLSPKLTLSVNWQDIVECYPA
jgi:hypothetical protein